MKKPLEIQRILLFIFFAGGVVWGQDIPDPYRWLEDGNSSQVQKWNEDQNQKAEAYLAKIPGQEKLTARLRELYDADSVSLPKQAGARLFYKRILAGREQPVFYWRSASNDLTDHPWLDPADFPAADHLSVGKWEPSPNGQYVAYAAQSNGSDEATLHVRDVGRQKDLLLDVIAEANFADVAWTPDSRGFYYMRLPAGQAGLPVSSTILEAERVAYADIRYHEIGRPPSQDPAIYPPTHDASQYLSPRVSVDGHWLFIIVARGWTSNDIYYADRQSPLPHFKPLFKSTAAVAEVAAWEDHFYLETNQNAPNGKIMRASPAALLRPLPMGEGRGEAWDTIIPERPGVTIESMHLAGGYIVLAILQNASNRVEVYQLKGGQPIWQIPIPDKGKVWDLSGRENQNDLYIEYQSFFVPTVIYRARLLQKKFDVWDTTDISVDASRFQADLVWYTSKDGTPVSMMVVHRKDLVRNGQAPLLLEGYGGFNTPILPRFSQEVLAWLEMGGVYAAPHLRGGGEYGESWHQAGMLTHKQNTFDDFIAAAEYLIKENYTRSEHLAIQGVSNGGLLVSAVMTQRPDLFRAVICKNPLTDMIRYSLFGEGRAWMPEYGSPDKPEEFKALLAYSPYHHVAKGTTYPSLLMFAGEHDDRVDPMHARKFVAAIQEANVSHHPVLFRLLKHTGHASTDRIQEQVKETSERLSFLKNELGM